MFLTGLRYCFFLLLDIVFYGGVTIKLGWITSLLSSEKIRRLGGWVSENACAFPMVLFWLGSMFEESLLCFFNIIVLF